MPSTFDLSNTTPPPPGEPHRHNINSAPPAQTPPPGGGRDFGIEPGYSGRGTGTPMDDIASVVLKISLVVGIMLLIYLLWGVFSGAWAHDAWKQMSDVTQKRQIANINLFSQGLQFASWVIVVSMLICAFRDESIGYVLVIVGALFYAGFAFIAEKIFSVNGMVESHGTGLVFQNMQRMAGIYAIPGVVFVLGDFIRRLRSYSENAAIQRANIKYGTNVAKQPASQFRNSVWGRCWELPYCRENVRQRCPIFLKRRGPCWWYKEGCMCEEKIILQAVLSPDWKDKTAQVAERQQPGLEAASRSHLTPAAKRDRCRKCVIYNEHQRQKYKVFSLATIAAVIGGLALFWVPMQSWVDQTLTTVVRLSDKLSFTDTTSAAQTHSVPEAVLWMVMGAIGLIVASQVIRLVAFCCFKLKI